MVYINIEMPKSCVDCNYTYEDYYLRDHCALTRDEVWDVSDNQRHYNCPLHKIEQRVGHWIDCGSYYRCSECDNWVDVVDGKSKFCDECGAKMLEGLNE